jgi:Family of unknown function (DUF5947)
MAANKPPSFESAFGTLRQFVHKPARNVERCDLCGVELAADHSHLIEVETRRLSCACQACTLLFCGQAGTRFKRIPRRVCSLADLHMSDADWECLMIPINMAFFFKSSLEGKVVAMYPSPAGATESLLPLEAWNSIVRANPGLDNMEPDVEAILINRIGYARGLCAPEYYLAPIDECYKLVGIIRNRWQGFSGGTEVWQEIAAFFAKLREKSWTGRAFDA